MEIPIGSAIEGKLNILQRNKRIEIVIRQILNIFLFTDDRGRGSRRGFKHICGGEPRKRITYGLLFTGKGQTGQRDLYGRITLQSFDIGFRLGLDAESRW